MISWVRIISQRPEFSTITPSPANCPALVRFVMEIRAASRARIPWDAARAPKPKLTEKYPIDENCKPTAKYGTLGLFRANQIPPEIQAIVVEKPGLNVAGGAIGIGEITSIPTAPAIADAYYRLTGEREFSLPLQNTPYAPKK